MLTIIWQTFSENFTASYRSDVGEKFRRRPRKRIAKNQKKRKKNDQQIVEPHEMRMAKATEAANAAKNNDALLIAFGTM